MTAFIQGGPRHFTQAAAILLMLAAGNASAARLTLNPSQVSLEGASDGVAGRLVDEQAAVGDPRTGTSAIPSSTWTSTSGSHVNIAVIDLGANYRIERIYIFDANGVVGGTTGNFTISSGSAAAGWTQLFDNALNHYQVWKGFPNDTANDGAGFVDDPAREFGVTTRYLRIVHPNGLAAVPEVVVYATPVGSTTATDVALGKPVIASSELREGTAPDYTYPNPPNLAVDGNDSTYWASSSSAGYFTYLEVELGDYYSLSRFDLEIGDDTTGGAPAAFEMQTQNQGCWKTVPGTVVQGNPASGRSKSFTLSSPIVTNRIRFVCPNKGGSCRVRTLAAIGVPATASAAAPPTCESAGAQVVRRAPSYDYAEFVPADYDDNPTQTFPLVIALHGITGEVLEADRSGLHSSAEGLVRQLRTAGFANFPAVVVSPHCRGFGDASNSECTFNIERLEALWRDLMSTYRVDMDRVYMTGLSRGGFVTLQFAALHAADLAAIVPIAGGLGLADDTKECNMKDLPVFAAHGTRDTTVLIRDLFNMQHKLNVTCAPVHPKTAIRVVVGAGHGMWDGIYADQRTYDWLFAQRASAKSLDATAHWPVVTTSGNKTIKLPAGSTMMSTTVSGSSTHPDGIAVDQYSWLNVTNTNAALTTACQSSTSASCELTGLTQGTHRFRLVVTDKKGFSGYKDLSITVTQ